MKFLKMHKGFLLKDSLVIKKPLEKLSIFGVSIFLLMAAFLSPLQEIFSFYILLAMYMTGAMCIIFPVICRGDILIKDKIWYSCLLVFFVSFMFNNKDMLIGGIASHLFVRTFICIMLLFLLPIQKSWSLKYHKLLFLSTYIHVIATIVFFMVPKLWNTYSKIVFKGVVSGTANDRGYTAALNGHYSTNGTLIAMAILCCAAYLFVSKNNKWWIPLALGFFAVLLTTKRAHLLFSIVAILAVYLVLNWNEHAIKTVFIMLIISILAVVSFFMVARYVPAVAAVLERLSSIGDDNSSVERFDMWKSAMEMFKSKPICGSGWGSFKYSNDFKGQNDNVLNAHNIYIQLLAENGIIGLSSFCAVAFSSMYRLIKTLYKWDKKPLYNSIYRALVFSALIQVFMLLYGLTGNVLYDFCLVYYVIALSAGEAIMHNMESLKQGCLIEAAKNGTLFKNKVK